MNKHMGTNRARKMEDLVAKAEINSTVEMMECASFYLGKLSHEFSDISDEREEYGASDTICRNAWHFHQWTLELSEKLTKLSSEIKDANIANMASDLPNPQD